MSDQLPRIVLSPTSDVTPIVPPAVPIVSPPPSSSMNTPSSAVTPNVPLQSVQPVKNATEKLPEKSDDTVVTQPTEVLSTTSVQAPEPSRHQTHSMPPAPIMQAEAPSPSSATTISPQQLKKQEEVLASDLEKINQEENKLLGTMKDWIGWIQGAETKKQTIERELKAIDQELQTVTGENKPIPQPKPLPPTAVGPSLAELEAKLQSVQSQFKTIQDQQRIEEKKAFDNYAAGGSNREGLMKEMERISGLYSQPLADTKAKMTALTEAIDKKMPGSKTAASPTPPVATTPTPEPPPAIPQTSATQSTPPDQTTPASKDSTSVILEHLRTLDIAQSGTVKQLLVDLPQQGQSLTIQRPAEGNGILVLAGTETNYTLAYHFSDADLIQAGLGADDIIPLPTGTLSATQLQTPPTPNA